MNPTEWTDGEWTDGALYALVVCCVGPIRMTMLPAELEPLRKQVLQLNYGKYPVRNREVLRLSMSGYPRNMVAARFGIAPSRVHQINNHLLRKLRYPSVYRAWRPPWLDVARELVE